MIYLDNAATTKPLTKALDSAKFINEEVYFNASARYHGGVMASNIVKTARENISKCIGSDFDVIFTSCGSEADNTAIYSYLRRGNAVTTLGEHSAVYEPFMDLKNKGYDSRFAKINIDGSVNEDSLLSLIDDNTVFVSVVHVNNETGAINDINKLAYLCKKKNPKIIFHSDGVQAFGKIPTKLSNCIDLYSVSAHKIGGLKGVGALIKNKKLKNLKPLILGGGQEFNLRSGTENVFGIKVFETATITKFADIFANFEKVKKVKEEFLSHIDKSVIKVISTSECSPYVISLSAVGLRGEVLQHMLEGDGVIVGTGSACNSKNPHSRVLREAGFAPSELDGVIRISFSSDIALDDAVYSAKKINEQVNKLKKAMKK
jgi:cysteine desulfurase